ncbi:thiamine ABC transporter ATP-binding protein [Lentibacter algarum]|uniref:thiamine ABC transporter ATP-binding protein n=1 Tax=Lentibacter algarum TaxID=576131 RepID=UPI001C07E6DD|nr:thiamine ABC transporter ATP-binding protein [Lentibacter algarum]
MLELDKILVRQGAFSLAADCKIEAAKRLVITGPSGAGKSTLLSVIAGFFAPSKGRILWQEREITQATPSERPVAMLFQDGNLFPHLTVWQNAALGLRPSLKLNQDEKARVKAALERVELAEFAQRKPGDLSGGQQSRVALARVLLQDKPLILLDEPFAALGPALRQQMLALVDEIAAERGAGVLMVSHDPQDAKSFADQVILVADGQVHAPRETAEIFANPPAALVAYLGES